MDSYVLPILVLGIAATMGYFWGKKKNSWISGWISRETEAALRPKSTEYVNIGGNIGYNFVYGLTKPYREAKGTFTLLPRHSLLFFPVSYVFTGADRYFLHLFTEEKLIGEGHILSEKQYRRERSGITGIGEMETETAEAGGRTFVLVYRGKVMREKLKKTLDVLQYPETLRHFCCYRQNRAFFCFLRPCFGMIEPFLASLLPELKNYFRRPEDGKGDEE